MALSIILLLTAFALAATAQTPSGVEPPASSPLIVQYPGSMPFSSGDELTIPGTQMLPTVSLASSSDASTYYTLVVVDPDAPSQTNTTFADVLHLLQSSLQASSNGSLVSSVPPFSSYIGPAPSAGTGPHRYTFFLYEQPVQDYTLPPEYEGLGSGEGRGKNITKFDVQRFVNRVNLTGPVGGTYFVVENKTESAGPTATASAGMSATGMMTGPTQSIMPFTGAAGAKEVGRVLLSVMAGGAVWLVL